MVTDKEILLEINELKKKIKDKEKLENCLIPHQVNEIKNSRHNYLDTLSRFLTSKKDICVAIYFHEHESTIELWITNNFRKAVYAEKCLEILCEFANSNSIKETKENLEKLLWLVVEKIGEEVGKTSQKLEKAKENNEIWSKVLKEWDDFINGLIRRKEEGKLDLLNWKEISENSNKIFQVLKSLDEKTRNHHYSDYLMPLHDLGLIIKGIDNNDVELVGIIEALKDRSKVKFSLGSNRVCEKILCRGCWWKTKKGREVDSANCEDCKKIDKDLKFCSDYKEFNCDVCMENSVHAEMKIINKVWSDEYLEKRITREEKRNFYIGIAKLCCSPCKMVIDKIFSRDEGKNIFHVRGTHGGLYNNWAIPSKISEEVKQEMWNWIRSLKLDEIGFEEKWDTTGEFPSQAEFSQSITKLSNLLEKNDEIHASTSSYLNYHIQQIPKN